MTMHEYYCVYEKPEEAISMTEFNKLEDLLKEYGISYTRTDADPSRMEMQTQIIVMDPRDKEKRLFDVIYFYGTYGYEHGLLEYWDENLKEEKKDPIGHVSAEWVMGYITAKFGDVLGL